MSLKIIVGILTIIMLAACQPAIDPPATSPADDTGATPAGIASVSTSINAFTFDLYNQIKSKESDNIFFSPYSISTAMSMLNEGAQGKTAEEISKVFHFLEDSAPHRSSTSAIYNKLNKKDAKYKLSTANALWVEKNYALLPDYTSTVSRYYGGKATALNFIASPEQSRLTINSWVEDNTNNKIKDLLPPSSITEATRMVLTNAIYFKGTWVKQFDKKETQEADFHLTNTTAVKVPMMSRTDRDALFPYAETDDMQLLELPYEGGNLSMFVLLPKDSDAALSLTAEKFNTLRSTLEEQRVHVYLPKFKFEKGYSLNDYLSDMGMPTAFTDSADFSGIDGTRSLSVSGVIHKAFIDVNEEGTEAAAATGIVMEATSVGSPIPVFRADHPFIFIIQEKETGAILFFGKVADPTR